MYLTNTDQNVFQSILNYSKVAIFLQNLKKFKKN